MRIRDCIFQLIHVFTQSNVERLKETKQHADKNQRELTRDRVALERKEAKLLAECKRMLKKGDTASAQLIAGQVQKYRALQQRNLTHASHLDLKTHTLMSDHKVNQAQVEGVKGYSWANQYETFGGLERREQRMGLRAGAVEYFEDSLRGCVDNIAGEGDTDVGAIVDYDSEVIDSRMRRMEMQSIMSQAMGKEKRAYFSQPDVVAAPFAVIVKSLNAASDDCGVIVSLNEVGKQDHAKQFSVSTFRVDELKRKIVEDQYNASQLDLVWSPSEPQHAGKIKQFKIGRVDLMQGGAFQTVSFHQTLEQAGIQDGDTLYVMTASANSAPTASDFETDDPVVAKLRDRMANIRVGRQ